MLKLTRERWAQVGITIQFLALVRTLGEILRLKYVLGDRFTIAVADPYIVGAMIAALFCWAAVVLFFLRRYTAVIFVSLGAVIALFAYKVFAIGL